MISITTGMTPTEFKTAIIDNFYIKDTIIVGDEIGQALLTSIDENYDYMRWILPAIPEKENLSIGMKGINFINSLNTDYQNIYDEVGEKADFETRFTLNISLKTTGASETKGLFIFCHTVDQVNAPDIDWGDGGDHTLRPIYPTYLWDVAVNHIYAEAGTYNVKIKNAFSIKKYGTYSDVRYNYQELIYTQFGITCPHIEIMYIGNGTLDNALLGDFTNITSLKNLHIDNISNGFIGDFSGYINLENYVVRAQGCHFSGSINNWNSIKEIYFASEDTFSGDVANIIATIESFESFTSVPGIQTQNTLHGSFDNATNLWMVCFSKFTDYENKIYCNIDTCLNLEYLSDNGCFVWSGTLTGKTKIWYMGAVGLTGNADLCTNMQYFYSTSAVTMERPTRINMFTNIDAISFAGWVYTAAEVNQLLADLWANRDETRTNYATYRSFSCNNVLTEAPTGQGLTDKANLQAYRTVLDDPAMPLWTITTN